MAKAAKFRLVELFCFQTPFPFFANHWNMAMAMLLTSQGDAMVGASPPHGWDGNSENKKIKTGQRSKGNNNEENKKIKMGQHFKVDRGRGQLSVSKYRM